jgi:hypothetical protein
MLHQLVSGSQHVLRNVLPSSLRDLEPREKLGWQILSKHQELLTKKHNIISWKTGILPHSLYLWFPYILHIPVILPASVASGVLLHGLLILVHVGRTSRMGHQPTAGQLLVRTIQIWSLRHMPILWGLNPQSRPCGIRRYMPWPHSHCDWKMEL